MSKQAKKALFFAGSFALGGGLLYLSLRGVDFNGVLEALRTANYFWLIPLLAVTLVAHLLRAFRWRLLLRTLDDEQGETPKVSLGLAFSSVMIGYMVNYAAPRLGEFARAGNVASRTSLRFPGVFGTVVVERILDVVTLFVALLTVLLLFGDRLTDVLASFLSGTGEVLSGVSTVAWAGLAVFGVLGVAAVAWWIRSNRNAQEASGGKLRGIALSFQDGLASLARVKERGQVLATTAGIWICYALMADIPLRMLGFAAPYNLRLIDSWALMNIGAIGMSLPSPGGTGSFHYVTVQTLVQLFSVAETPAATYALFAHASQLVLFCAIGFVCLLVQGTSFRSVTSAATEARESGGA